MSEEQQTPESADGPRPEPLRFFGTSWVDRGRDYALRRVGVAAGSLLAAAAGAVVLRLGYDGLDIAAVGGAVSMLVVVVFAVCSAVAFRRTWEAFVRPGDDADPGVERSLSSIRAVGFIGVLLAWFCRSLVEAPGEGLHRAAYELRLEQHRRRRASRTGNPASRKRKRR